MNKLDTLVTEWRSMGPTNWSQHEYGWVMPDGKPVTLEPWQRAILDTWWQHRQDVTTLAISNVKKTGKTTLNAILLAWRWLALPSEHLTLGNDLDQSMSRQFGMVADMVKRHSLLGKHVKATIRKLVFEPTGSTIEALERDAAGRSGSNHLSSSHTECWGVVYESAVRAYEELTPPPGLAYGLPALRICDSYAGYEGESETWHDLVDRGLAGERVSDDWPIHRANGLLLFHMAGEEARERCFRGTPEQAKVYYDDQRQSLRTGTFARLHDNRRAASEDAFITTDQWGALMLPGYRCPMPDKSVRLVLGVDLSTRHDHAGVVSVYRGDKGLIHLGPYKVFKPAPVLDFATVENYITSLARDYSIVKMAYDPYQCEFLAQRLRRRGINAIEFPQTLGNLTRCGNRLFDVIRQGQLVVYAGADDLRTHVLNARGKETDRGTRLVKQKASRKIDLAICLAMAVAEVSQALGKPDIKVLYWDNDGRVHSYDPRQQEKNDEQRRAEFIKQAGEAALSFRQKLGYN